MQRARIILLIGLFLAAAGATPAIAGSFGYNLGGGRVVIVPAETTIQDNYVRAAETIEMNGTVTGDVIVAAGTVTISGDVAGDVLAAAGTLRITGDVGGNVRAVAGDIDIAGSVGRNVTVGTGELLLQEGSTIGGTLAFGAGIAELRGAVGSHVDGSGGSVLIAGMIAQDVRLNLGGNKDEAGTLVVLPAAVIGGKLAYTSTAVADIQPGATIQGAITRTAPSDTGANVREAFANFWFFVRIAGLFGALVVGLVLLSFFRGEAHVVLDEMRSRSLRSIAFGLLYVVLTPIVVGILLFTVIGIPLGLILLGLYLIALYVAHVFAGMFVGAWLARSVHTPHGPDGTVMRTWPLLLGIVVYALVVDVLLGWPVDGPAGILLGALSGIIKFVFGILALGALVEGKRKLLRHE